MNKMVFSLGEHTQVRMRGSWGAQKRGTFTELRVSISEDILGKEYYRSTEGVQINRKAAFEAEGTACAKAQMQVSRWHSESSE